ncbi:MAG: hypothetical protein Q8N04_01630 [Nitrospira sp.]|nr:hypothetical protein [Nitrospira sp.]
MSWFRWWTTKSKKTPDAENPDQFAPHLTRDQVQKLLGELKKERRIHLTGVTGGKP